MKLWAKRKIFTKRKNVKIFDSYFPISYSILYFSCVLEGIVTSFLSRIEVSRLLLLWFLQWSEIDTFFNLIFFYTFSCLSSVVDSHKSRSKRRLKLKTWNLPLMILRRINKLFEAIWCFCIYAKKLSLAYKYCAFRFFNVSLHKT